MDRYLSVTDVWAIAFGCIIGWGAFVMPGTTFLPVAGPGGTVVAMAISAFIMLIIGKNYAYLMIRHPGTGGVYSYTKEAFGRDHAFLCSWFLCLSYISIVFLNATALFLVTRTLFGSQMQSGFHYAVAGHTVYLSEVLLSVAALGAVGLLFILKKPLLQRIQTVLALVLLAGSLIITLVCLPRAHTADLFSLSGPDGRGSPSVILTIVLLSPWAFVGFDVISLETAHFRFPVRRSKGIIALSIVLGGFVYAAMSLVSITSVPDGARSWQDYILNLEKLNGIETVHAIRKTSNVPIIMLTAKSEDTDKVLGLNVGADDYVTKPFNPLELLARVRSQLRRYTQLGSQEKPAEGIYTLGGLQLDDLAKEVTVDGEKVAMTPTEYAILKLFLLHPGEVLSPNRIYREVWQDEPIGVESTVAVHIRHLREKIEINPSDPRYLKVVWGQGYKLVPQEDNRRR